MSDSKTCKRRLKLVDRGLQTKIIVCFMAAAIFSLTLQVIVVAGVMTQAVISLPESSAFLLQKLDWMLMGIFLVGVGVTLPLTYLLALNLTFRILGPIYRFKLFLEALKAGERPEDCRIRKDDDLQAFCALLNEATAPLRQRTGEQPQPADLTQAA